MPLESDKAAFSVGHIFTPRINSQYLRSMEKPIFYSGKDSVVRPISAYHGNSAPLSFEFHRFPNLVLYHNMKTRTTLYFGGDKDLKIRENCVLLEIKDRKKENSHYYEIDIYRMALPFQLHLDSNSKQIWEPLEEKTLDCLVGFLRRENTGYCITEISLNRWTNEKTRGFLDCDIQ